MNNLVVSFLKQHKIPYVINKEEKIIRFICLICNSEAKISMYRTHWKCPSCSESGTIVHLINFIEEFGVNANLGTIQFKIYDEKKEIEEIKHLLAEVGDHPSIKIIQQKLSIIFDKKKHTP